jgi:DivIVA domain-containing protein
MKKKDTTQDVAQGFAPGEAPTPAPPSAPTAVASKPLTALDIQQKEFRVSRFGGYKMRDVDEFLDRITEAMSAMSAEGQRLRGGDPRAVVGTSDLDDVNRQADEIIQRARTEAARILAEAGSAAGGAGVAGGAAAAAISGFLTHEKEFLQSLAGLVQDHAESVKSMARTARSSRPSAPPAPPAQVASPTAPAKPKTAMAAPTEPPAPAKASPPAPDRDRAAARAIPPASEATVSVPKAEEPVRVHEPEPASVSRAEGDDGVGDETGDSSLRELFWGED